MAGKRIVLLFMIGMLMQSPVWGQTQSQEAEIMGEEIDEAEEISAEDMDMAAGETDEEEEALFEEEGNKGYIYNSPLPPTEETKKMKKTSLWQDLKKMDEWFQEHFW